MIFNDATRAQIEAADPNASTWLAANAGSGKTRVLTDRVARLLLQEVEPQHILCLTYTKAAASEMQNRLFKRLGSWAMLEDDALRTAMAELGVIGSLDGDALRRARTLFALAIETPGGLKIQTIHSFCASLLRRFPLEAGVSPQFTEIEDRAADLLRADILDQMSEGKDAGLVADLARFYTGDDWPKLTKEIVGKRDSFSQQMDLAAALKLLGQPATLTQAAILSDVFLGTERALIDHAIPLLLASGPMDQGIAKSLNAIPSLDWDSLSALENIFVYGSNTKNPFTAKLDRVPTNSVKKALGPRLDDLQAFMLRLEDARPRRLALLAAEKTVALHRFAQTFISRYEAAKQLRGWLDFDDLILKARALLSDPKVAAWVLYRIDGGIDHILVDEAQDTSPRQWDVIERLTDEFYSGDGAHTNRQRTLFVVGDKKQSIYSFQGADPLEFDRKRALFQEKIEAAGQRFENRSLDYSFRSSSAVLRLVDTVFDPRRRPEFGNLNQHIAFKDTLPGRVDLWPAVEAETPDDDPEWTDPLDRISPSAAPVLLAKDIAQRIKEMTDPENPTFIPDDEKDGVFRRPVRAGDFLILVQSRSALFSELIRACKAADLPIAGADRLKVGAELAVKDLGAVLAFLATPDDDLSLATALKSPLFGWTEQDLFTLAHHRPKGSQLWEALRTQTDTHPETIAALRDLRGQVDFLRPYDLIERILTRHDGRRKLLSRLGAEAEDGINAMLTQALAYEQTDIPSLTGFIEWMQTDDLEIKRQVDSASNQIRVMTVHGSKGLEAPIVILPDTKKREIQIKDQIILHNGTPTWKPKAAELPEDLRTAVEDGKDMQRAERLRLLYVAMTRAEKWLMIARADEGRGSEDPWYGIMAEAMGHVNGTALPDSGILRFEEGEWDTLPTRSVQPENQKKAKFEPVFKNSPPIFSHPPAVLSPSDLGGQKALPGDAGDETEAAMAFGTLVHTLLEKLPAVAEDERPDLAAHLTREVDPETATRAMADAARCMDSPTLSHIFGPDTLTEVPVTGVVKGSRLHGVLDRLLITDDSVTLIDYKTNRTVPRTATACPNGILRQMGAYAAILSQIYPGKKIETAILWTATGTLMPLPHDLVAEALDASPYLDGARAHS